MNRIGNRLSIAVLAGPILILVTAFANASASESELAATPPMGWANWNSLGCKYDEGTIRAMADRLVSTGMRDVGYRYLIIQECIVPAGHRAADGTLIPDPAKFPNGIPALVAYIHSKGLKAGIYTDLGPKTCAEYEGSYQHEEQDARTFALWGIDLIEEDFCYKPEGFTAAQLYTRMRDAIAHTGRPMLFYICNWGRERAWTWAPGLSNAWRSTGDVGDPGHADWDRILRNFDQNALHAASGGRDHWSDPDMLEVGVPGISEAEEQSVFSLWAMSAAPLWAGNDLVKMSAQTQRILTNREVITVDQDPLGQPATMVLQDDPGLQVWARPLGGKSSPQAVLLFNRTAQAAKMYVQWEDLGIYGSVAARDLWSHRDLGVLPKGYEALVPAHGVVMLRIDPQQSK
ncbi:MAG: glycoside hydrolase family 27 protein [Terracidiphilus sp.]|jgi:alpha-galactosidase